MRARTTAAAMSAALSLSWVLGGCGGDEVGRGEEVPEPGPLRLHADGDCEPATSDGFLLSAARAVNTAEIPLTIDEVHIVGADNLRLVEALVDDDVPAVDATMAEGARHGLLLHVELVDPAVAASYDSVTVDYHNVEGRYRAVGQGSTLSCPG